jgi:hypothetical protein
MLKMLLLYTLYLSAQQLSNKFVHVHNTEKPSHLGTFLGCKNSPVATWNLHLRFNLVVPFDELADNSNLIWLHHKRIIYSLQNICFQV